MKMRERERERGSYGFGTNEATVLALYGCTKYSDNEWFFKKSTVKLADDIAYIVGILDLTVIKVTRLLFNAQIDESFGRFGNEIMSNKFIANLNCEIFRRVQQNVLHNTGGHYRRTALLNKWQ
jgi:hypothetical protein